MNNCPQFAERLRPRLGFLTDRSTGLRQGGGQ
jgi:hypothetical protein